jgi:tetratricopeptide (TPR) repeat protein
VASLQRIGPERKIAGAAGLGRAALFALAIGALAILPARRAPAQGTRSESDQMVAQAENTIRSAGKSNPVDTAKVHQAIDELHKALAADPNNDSAYVDLGFCYGLLRDGPTAVDMYMHAVHINPSPANFLELSDIYMRVGDAEHALMAANAGILKAPRNARLYNAKGMALNDLARPAEASEAFQKAIEIDPNFLIARDNLHALNSGSSGRGSVSRH